ncbi:MAG: Asp23/Gls24 family envelope stress response protein [Verrucomicrobia bacterium CG_4_10_14_3_um_filter_43_23]|nr:MAG: hypothetical protein AUJ82_02875 [Verrucomicrobia bacterium CG1_02_43_26]PIP59398.1 MAG: Asp23/Gls24 family envelope stress response protein [Verrucomicrobia bacterium CG22_combo_CG10-13_8_21_14_all_43_17]PIX58478.1 MAG: Asp23/Gls24 family envelope stress response protein [Verrucomicrobia bacterium CG_4_10_14_3_um_filter_43_23]PIY62228.1 MAG: Asp23/Gls24 family envelope stress response protein [Verrucomicrobia bacterium CG_4_10_14_0_8_um_filter_43_34]PJA44308.1 MAG: Asp23/Gls24 family e
MSAKKTDTFEDTKIPTINEESNDMMGDIKINHSVVASIVRLAATEIDGVHAVGSSFVDGIAEIFSKKETERGVRVTEDEAGHYVIDIRVILSFGVELAKVAVQIQENVRSMVTRMTMKNVSRVNVIIDGVKMETASPEEHPDYEKSIQ